MSRIEHKQAVQNVVPVKPTLSLRELAEVLVKHYDLSEGQYDLLLEYQIGIGAVGPDKENLVPGAMIGITRMGLLAAASIGPNTVDAAKVNPSRKTRGKASKAAG